MCPASSWRGKGCDRMRKRIFVFLITSTLVLSALFCGCGKSQPAPQGNEEKLSELGNAFADDLQRNILPYRENPRSLTDYGYVLSQNGKTYGVDFLTEFFMTYQDKKDGEVTIIFAGTSFVASRVVVANGAVYYLRYEYDKLHPDDIAIDGQFADSVSLKYEDSVDKWTLTLTTGKKDLTFELKNPS